MDRGKDETFYLMPPAVDAYLPDHQINLTRQNSKDL